MVPVDDNGNVLPGYEHLLEPRVVLLNREEIQKLNNTRPGNGQMPLQGTFSSFLSR